MVLSPPTPILDQSTDTNLDLAGPNKVMRDSSDCLSSEDEDCPDEYDPDGVVCVHLPLNDDHFHLNDARHTTRSNAANSLRELYWMVSAIATFINLLAGCYNRFSSPSSYSLLNHICGAVAICLWALACSPAPTISSVHQWMTGGVIGARGRPSSGWRCPRGVTAQRCRPSCCCTRYKRRYLRTVRLS